MRHLSPVLLLVQAFLLLFILTCYSNCFRLIACLRRVPSVYGCFVPVNDTNELRQASVQFDRHPKRDGLHQASNVC